MTSVSQKPEWVLRLSTIASKVKEGKMPSSEAASEVRAAYIDFLKTAYVKPDRWIKEEAEAWDSATKRPVAPAAALLRWAVQLESKGGRRMLFFMSAVFQAVITEIRLKFWQELI